MNGKRVLFILFLNIIFVFIFVKPVKAFLAATGITILASSLLPHLLCILINMLLTVVALIKKNRRTFGLFLVILAISMTYFIREYIHIRNLNASPIVLGDVNVNDWEMFRIRMKDRPKESKGGIDVQRYNVERLEVKTYNPQDYSVVIGKTLSKFSLANTKFEIGGDFFLNLVNMAFEEDDLVRYLAERGVTKTDRILLYCPSGSTSSFAAYILDHYGYNVRYLPLKKAISPPLEDEAGDFYNERFLLKKIDLNNMGSYPYVYFMLIINNYYRWGGFLCDKEVLPGDITLLKANDRIEHSKGFFCKSTPLQQVEISTIDIPFYSEKLSFKKNTRILCDDRWHCFLTEHYLYEHQLHRKFKTLYCTSCDDN